MGSRITVTIVLAVVLAYPAFSREVARGVLVAPIQMARESG